MPNEWISVEERLPTDADMWKGHGHVIAAFESGAVQLSWVSRFLKGWAHETPQDKVTHWMPFPDPPKEGEE